VNDYITEHNLDVLVLTETWLTKKTEDRLSAEVLPKGYAMLHRMRDAKRGGGVAVIFRNSIKAEVTKRSPDAKLFELLEVKIESGGSCVQLIVVYRPDRKTEFHEEFAQLLVQWASSLGKVIVLGDFNVHWDKPTDPDTKKLQSCLDEASFQQHIT
jgi:exonuclease III